MDAGSKAVHTLLAPDPPAVRRLAVDARSLIVGAMPEVEETVDAPARVIGYGFGRGYQGMVCTIILSKSGVKIGLVQGAELPDPRHLLGGKGKGHRYLEVNASSDLTKPGVKVLLKAALSAWTRRTAP